jgi:ATP-dependent protease HslVU (ClpYQ) peptidase subunit
MTTIVCNREYMASDSQITDGQIKTAATTKLFRGPDDSVLGFSGDYNFAIAMIDFICGRTDSFPDEEDNDIGATVLCLRRDGIWSYERSPRPLPIAEAFAAIGSGAAIALGALYMKATPIEAVRAACAHDIYSGGEIKVMRLDGAKQKRRAAKA